MNNDPSRQVQQMKAQCLQSSHPPKLGQTLSLHHRKDIISQNIQTKPSGVGKEAPTRQASTRQIILQHLEDLLWEMGKWGQTSLFSYFAFAALDRILFQPII
jgi:hypothetical protein